MIQYRLIQLEEIIDKYLVADKATHLRVQQILAELKSELQKKNGKNTEK